MDVVEEFFVWLEVERKIVEDDARELLWLLQVARFRKSHSNEIQKRGYLHDFCLGGAHEHQVKLAFHRSERELDERNVVAFGRLSLVLDSHELLLLRFNIKLKLQ